MKCPVKPGDYHMPIRPKFVVTIYDCQLKVTNVITGSLPYDVIEDLKDLEGLQAAKDAWWTVYEGIREIERKQNESISQ
jgi:hypothetical protein